MLALNRSVVNCRIGKLERNCRHKVNYSRDLRSYGMLRSVNWYLPTFRDNLSVPSSRGKQCQAVATLPLKIGPIGCPETSVRNYQYMLCNIQKSADLICNVAETWNNELPLLFSFSRFVIYIAIWNSRGLVFSTMGRGLNSQNNLSLRKLYWNGWLAISFYPK
jgi:hypothetical protein